VQVDITLIAATNRNLEQMVEEGSFRRDLYARLAMAKIYIPSLADRREDIFAIACELSKRMNTELMEDAIEVEAVERLILEPWPNNVRELDAALMSVRSLDPKPGVRLWALEEVLGKRRGNRTVLTEETVRGAIEDSGGNMSLAAETLGVTRGKLLRFWKRVAGNDG
jgi:DNA-binding NtrC family response regulator